jgi:spermidine/putrescine transport system substrate-binding protein
MRPWEPIRREEIRPLTHPLHPKERASYSRRDFLRRAAAAGLAVPSLSAILAACGADPVSTDETSVEGNPFGVGGVAGAPYPLARPSAPVTWNVDESRLVPSDAKPEKDATLRILRWPSYLAPSVIRSFEQRYGCTVEETEFTDMDHGLTKINSGIGDYDVLVGLHVWALGRSIAADLFRPLNLDLVPNLSANCWDSFQSPFYDTGARYTVPYSVWSTGIFWRNDKLAIDIAGMGNPYDVFWSDAPVNKTHLLDNAQDVLSMAMFRDGITEVNDVDEATVNHAKDAIAEIVDATNASFDHHDSLELPKGKAWLHQSWSGSVADAFVFLPEGDRATNLSYLWPVDAGVPGNVDNDLLVVLNSGKAPVLAHLLLDHILDVDNALTNFATWTGYQVPQKTMTRDALVEAGLTPEHLANVFLEEPDMDRGSRELELPAAMDAVWQAAYAEVHAKA